MTCLLFTKWKKKKHYNIYANAHRSNVKKKKPEAGAATRGEPLAKEIDSSG
jgi:hypothetical protein